jgi:hypothetical protein
MGIEPTSEAWEASILPLYDARSGVILLHLSCDQSRFPFSIIFQFDSGFRRLKALRCASP